jgi:hypothetical protein
MIWVDTRLLDRIGVHDLEISLELKDLEVSLEIEDGPQAAIHIVDKLRSYPRQMPIVAPDAYEDAVRRLIARGPQNDEIGAPFAHLQGSEASNQTIYVRGQYLVIGGFAFKLSEVEEYGLHGADIPLPDGGAVQAALALMVIALQERAQDEDDYVLLAERVRRYQATHQKG